MNQDTVLNFWFNPENKPKWFVKDTQFDQKIADMFQKIHDAASQAELWSWRTTAEGRLAEIIILDQFSRNLFRDHPNAFAQDALALALAQEAISLELDQALPPEQCSFLYMPFMHSESQVIHEHAVVLFEKLGNPLNLDFEYKHKVIIDRFGRYPHRNKVLGRTSTAEEQTFLTEPNSHF
ncbi:DUF924 family protein [Acinetobacter nectaris]|uniref:DUF924 family protein n=1 Tax=Acinetobacter nectaris TaxID=1219382 RepID=UPI001F3108EC|nr:DUF924 family protein [Acinetobacter nectaris]MCF8998319.1 DUF924 domain-containing protein [Acinetobacter nectaris]MCF9027829.1 DUF924 domain-containing protein [Acinetobacter nectaris]